MTPRPRHPGRSAPGRDARGLPRRPRARGSSCRSPPRRKARARAAVRNPIEEHLDRAQLLVAPDNSRFTHRLVHCGRREPRLNSTDRLRHFLSARTDALPSTDRLPGSPGPLGLLYSLHMNRMTHGVTTDITEQRVSGRLVRIASSNHVRTCGQPRRDEAGRVLGGSCLLASS